jgi:hypothetical protein
MQPPIQKISSFATKSKTISQNKTNLNQKNVRIKKKKTELRVGT